MLLAVLSHGAAFADPSAGARLAAWHSEAVCRGCAWRPPPGLGRAMFEQAARDARGPRLHAREADALRTLAALEAAAGGPAEPPRGGEAGKPAPPRAYDAWAIARLLLSLALGGALVRAVLRARKAKATATSDERRRAQNVARARELASRIARAEAARVAMAKGKAARKRRGAAEERGRAEALAVVEEGEAEPAAAAPWECQPCEESWSSEEKVEEESAVEGEAGGEVREKEQVEGPAGTQRMEAPPDVSERAECVEPADGTPTVVDGGERVEEQLREGEEMVGGEVSKAQIQRHESVGAESVDLVDVEGEEEATGYAASLATRSSCGELGPTVSPASLQLEEETRNKAACERQASLGASVQGQRGKVLAPLTAANVNLLPRPPQAAPCVAYVHPRSEAPSEGSQRGQRSTSLQRSLEMQLRGKTSLTPLLGRSMLLGLGPSQDDLSVFDELKDHSDDIIGVESCDVDCDVD